MLETGFLASSDTILDYLEAHPETVTTMPFSISANLSLQSPQNEKLHRLRRFNLALLNPNTFLPVISARETSRPRDSSTPTNTTKNISDLPHSSKLAKEEHPHEDS